MKQFSLTRHYQELDAAGMEILLATSAEEVEQCLLALGKPIDQ